MNDIVRLAIWAIIPLILLGIIYFARLTVYRTAEGEHRVSVRAGHYAGFVAFATFVVWQASKSDNPFQLNSLRATIELDPTIFAAIALFGYFLVYLIRNLIPTRMGGLLVLFLVFAGSASMFSLFFDPNHGSDILSGTLGLALGILLHAVMSPKSIYEIFPEVHKDPFELSEHNVDQALIDDKELTRPRSDRIAAKAPAPDTAAPEPPTSGIPHTPSGYNELSKEERNKVRLSRGFPPED